MSDIFATPAWLSIREAAMRSGRSMDTVRRALRAGRFPNAARRDTGDRGWRISVADLVAAGFRASPPATPAAVSVGGADVGARPPDDLSRELTRLREELTALRAENSKLREHTLALLDRLVAAAGGAHR